MARFNADKETWDQLMDSVLELYPKTPPTELASMALEDLYEVGEDETVDNTDIEGAYHELCAYAEEKVKKREEAQGPSEDV
jgi:hypothetical protein